MKNQLVRIALVAVVASVVFAAGCNPVDTSSPNLGQSQVVLHDRFCVRFDENRTTGEFESEVVCDQFATQIQAWLANNNVASGDVKKIFMSGGRIKLAGEFTGHAWDITSSVRIKRTDIADGPVTFLKEQTVTIPDDIDGSKGYKPRFDSHGVKLVNRALEDLVDGGDPVLVVTMKSTDVDPEPSGSDPLVFSWEACVDIMAIVKKGGGGGDDDDDDDNSDGGDDGDDDDNSDHDGDD